MYSKSIFPKPCLFLPSPCIILLDSNVSAKRQMLTFASKRASQIQSYQVFFPIRLSVGEIAQIFWSLCHFKGTRFSTSHRFAIKGRCFTHKNLSGISTIKVTKCTPQLSETSENLCFKGLCLDRKPSHKPEWQVY